MVIPVCGEIQTAIISYGVEAMLSTSMFRVPAVHRDRAVFKQRGGPGAPQPPQTHVFNSPGTMSTQCLNCEIRQP